MIYVPLGIIVAFLFLGLGLRYSNNFKSAIKNTCCTEKQAFIYEMKTRGIRKKVAIHKFCFVSPSYAQIFAEINEGEVKKEKGIKAEACIESMLIVSIAVFVFILVLALILELK